MPATIVITPEISLGFGGIHADRMAEPEAQRFAETVDSFRKPISISAPAVCIDGRRLADGEIPLELGAHIAGGAMTLFVGAEAANHPFTGAALLEYANKQGFNFGAHCDDGNKAASFASGTGCGANDRLPEIGKNFRENKDAVSGVVQSLLGDEFDAQIMAGIVLPEPHEWDKNYLMATVGENNVETLHDDGKGVHGHQEAMVIFNMVPNTTIDRDALVAETGKQVFVVDVWYIKELADKLATGPNAAEQAKQMYHAMVAYQAATYITLCDGSHRAAVLKA